MRPSTVTCHLGMWGPVEFSATPIHFALQECPSRLPSRIPSTASSPSFIVMLEDLCLNPPSILASASNVRSCTAIAKAQSRLVGSDGADGSGSEQLVEGD